MDKPEKPSIEDIAWVFEHLVKHLDEGGTFRQLVQARMGFGPDTYLRLIEAGGMEISNALDWASTMNAMAGPDDTEDMDIVIDHRAPPN